jgi:hypothetical protein
MPAIRGLETSLTALTMVTYLFVQSQIEFQRPDASMSTFQPRFRGALRGGAHSWGGDLKR